MSGTKVNTFERVIEPVGSGERIFGNRTHRDGCSSRTSTGLAEISCQSAVEQPTIDKRVDGWFAISRWNIWPASGNIFSTTDVPTSLQLSSEFFRAVDRRPVVYLWLHGPERAALIR